MTLKEFKTELVTATCSYKSDYFATNVGSTDIEVYLNNGMHLSIDVNATWRELIDRSVDYDTPTIDQSRNELELTEIYLYDLDGESLEVTPEINEALIEWVGNYFQCECY